MLVEPHLKGSRLALLVACSNSHIATSLEDNAHLVDVVHVPVHQCSMVCGIPVKVQFLPVQCDAADTCRERLRGTERQNVAVGLLGRIQ